MSEATAALIVAIVGALTGLLALAWNAVSWLREGPRVTLTAWIMDENDDSVAVTVWNTGRSAAFVSGLVFSFPDPTEEGGVIVPVVGTNMLKDLSPVPANGSAFVSLMNLSQMPDLWAALQHGEDVLLTAVLGPGRRRRAATRVALFRPHPG
jgi:hypothetical protein